jgi:cyclopropane fatty-acyl-phospholipid synthase-like methyltransferase
MRALDVGCGNGKTVSSLLREGAEATGLDFSAEAIESCRSLFGDRAEFVVADSSDMPFADGSFDVVTAVHVFEHLRPEEAAATAAEIERVLAPGGTALVRSFAVGDSRSGGLGEGVRGNGIRYRYFTEEGLAGLFPGLEALSVERIDETMRFGAVRVRIECLLRAPG